MTNSIHTPGPWHLASAEHNRVKLINDGNGDAVGEYVDCRKASDARLIAAAPELLETLCSIYESGLVAKTDPLVHDFIADLIAKARGE